jgi:hypothetical protein
LRARPSEALVQRGQKKKNPAEGGEETPEEREQPVATAATGRISRGEKIVVNEMACAIRGI